MMSRGENSIHQIQKFVPMILVNERYFKSYAKYLSDSYDFNANEEHLLRKLNSYLENSFRNDPVRLAQRLIKGEHKDKTKETWIWLSADDVATIAREVVDSYMN